ncbi:MAG: undecaprenyl-phosphate glucose phosphotransferase [Cyclobacteriaceae bacterium]
MNNIGYSKYLKTVNVIGDVLIMNAAYLLTYHFTFEFLSNFTRSRYFELLLFYNIAWILSVSILKTHNITRVMSVEEIVKRLLNTMMLYLILIFAYLGIKGGTYNKVFVFQSYLITCVALGLVNTTLTLFLKKYRKVGFNYRNTIIAGYGEIATELKEYFANNAQLGYNLLGIFDDKFSTAQVRGKISDMEQFSKENNIHEIYCCLPYVEPRQVRRLIRYCENNFIRIKIIPDFRGFPYKNVEVSLYDFIPILNFKPAPLEDQVNLFVKRLFDILFSALVLMFIMSWLVPLFALLIKMDSKGPVFFIQKRSGRNNRTFNCYKFRTMQVNTEANLKQASKNDSRITKIGAFLRKTNLDEMPQFLNVIKGEMSVVGPRPHMLKHTEEFFQSVDKFMLRHYVKPGITGLAQAKGYRGETNTKNKLRNRVKLDRFYVENWTLLFDLKIIIMTVYSMIKGDDNAY